MIQGQNCFRARIFQIGDLSWRIKRDVIFFLILLPNDCIFLFHFVGDYKTELRRKDMNAKSKWFSISFDFVICNFLLHILNVANLKKNVTYSQLRWPHKRELESSYFWLSSSLYIRYRVAHKVTSVEDDDLILYSFDQLVQLRFQWLSIDIGSGECHLIEIMK